MKEEIFMEKYIPLVKSIAKKYKNFGVDFDDLVQEGLLGILEAEKKFNPLKGTKFSTYATYWIKKKILEALEREKKFSLGSVSLDEDIETVQEAPSSGSEEVSLPRFDISQDLPELEAKILTMFLIERKTLREISQDLGMRREKVRQLKEKAIRQLKINQKLTESLYAVNNRGV